MSEEWISPSAKSRFVVVEKSDDKLVIAFTDDAGDIGPPEHLHPGQDEVFTVLDGELVVKVDGIEHRLRQGESVLVKRGQAHTFWNPTRDVVRFTSEHRPALAFESFLKTIYDLDRDGLANERGQPHLLQLMTILKARGGEEFIVGPPRFAQRIAAFILGSIGALAGKQPIYVSRSRLAR